MSTVGYVITKIESCPKCGFMGKINDWKKAKQLGIAQHIVTCPECKGKGEKRTQVSLQDALMDILNRC